VNVKLLVGVSLALGTALTLVSCNDLFRGCTDMGCFDGLSVHVIGIVGEEYEITASDSDDSMQSGSCVAGPAGTCDVSFAQFHPTEVTIVVTGGGMTANANSQPDYIRSQPNGSGCDPICYRATIEVSWCNQSDFLTRAWSRRGTMVGKQRRIWARSSGAHR
jgi:hypothetical protein